MKTVKTNELTGAALDWAVAKCEGYECEFGDEVSGPWLVPQEGYLHDEKPLASFRPSTNWAQGGPIIERECMEFEYDEGPQSYLAANGIYASTGKTHLIAAMRCYVTSKLGDEVEVPEELVG